MLIIVFRMKEIFVSLEDKNMSDWFFKGGIGELLINIIINKSR